MKLIKDKKFLQNVAQYIDLTNTIGGGVSQPIIKMDKREEGAVLRVMLPGVEPEQWQVVVDRNTVTVMALHQNENNPAMQAPLFLHNFVLPPLVDYSQLSAEFKGKELRIMVPFLPKGPRVLDIDYRY
ncbi:Hsp20/alpha crystallin family protein [Rufibacter roseus]|uniref:Hsp20/alpha crystallin family protein n=1 Tax=Rufibacter roseus TaxID=1567108 RepID=A0ABW2DIN6_9BACT|nr:Hsp20/alpha crystallin family protein [Rufibacter roseus]